MVDTLHSVEEYDDELKYIIACMSDIRRMTTVLNKHVNNLQKKINKDLKNIEKKSKNDKKKDTKEPQGFSKPTLISDEFCDFIKLPHGSKIARCNAVSYISKYVSENNLYYSDNKKMFNLDDKLMKLLKANENDEVGFFTIQRWLNHHFLESKKCIINKKNDNEEKSEIRKI